MLTFYWEEVKKGNDLVELRCFHTQQKLNKTRRIMYSAFVLPDEVEGFKKTFEKTRRCVMEGGAWKPIQGAVWSFLNDQWIIDKSQIIAPI